MSHTHSDQSFALVVVSNRLPVVSRKGPNGETVSTLSPGGLVAAVAPALAGKKAAWVGWSGSDDSHAPPLVVEGITVFPVPLSTELVDAHYEGYSNSTLWPLFHHVGVPHQVHQGWFDAYSSVNQRFAEHVAALVAPGGVVWVHDYQVMLLPQMMKSLRPDVTVGYFHHIPFPPLEILSDLPEAQQIVEGLASADLVGFQRESDSENFRAALKNYARETASHNPRVGTYPISIDFDAVAEQAGRPGAHQRAVELRESWGNPRKVLLGVDRIDYTKGIPERLEAFEQLLDSGQVSASDVVFVQAGSPSRENVSSYQELRERIDSIVARINHNHTQLSGGGVVRYIAENLPRDEMLALFVAADVMVVSALRDGMNLVAKEFIACTRDNSGVLVLSTETGAADQMPDAVLADPSDPAALARALLQALTMDSIEIGSRMAALRGFGAKHDVSRWSADFLADLASSATA